MVTGHRILAPKLLQRVSDGRAASGWDSSAFARLNHKDPSWTASSDYGVSQPHTPPTMYELALQVDVVVADGGSTDGSLEHGFLQEHGVRALLTKVEDGKLGGMRPV